MAAYTTTQLRTVGIQPASTDAASYPGPVVLEFDFDGAKRSTAATDTVDFFDIPALSGFIVRAASLTVVRPGTATGTADIQLGGVDVTGLTAWALDAAAGTQLVKLATAANTVVNAGSASAVRLQINTVGVGTGRFRVRVFGDMLTAASGAQ
jgi:hypothetical protein